MDEISDRINKMWHDLGERFEGAIADAFIDGKSVQAMRLATYAEACFWQSTGDGSSHDIKDVLPPVADITNLDREA